MTQFTLFGFDTFRHNLLSSLRRFRTRLGRGKGTVEAFVSYVLSAAAGTLMGVLIRGVVSTPKEALSAIEKDISDLRGHIRAIESEHNKLSHNISSNYTDKTELRIIIGELKEMIKRLEKSIDNLHMKRITD